MFVSIELVTFNHCTLLRPDCEHLLTQTIQLQLKSFIKNGIILWFYANDAYIKNGVFGILGSIKNIQAYLG